MVTQRGVPGGTWYCVLSMIGEDGKRIKKWISLPNCKTEKQAKKEEARINAEKEGGRFVPPSRQTVKEFLGEWLQGSSHITAKTREGYEKSIRVYLVPQLGSVRLTELTSNQIRIAYAQLLETSCRYGNRTLSPQTVTTCHRVLKAALNQAVKDGGLIKNPADAVKPPRVQKRNLRILGVEETAELLEKIADTPYYLPTLIAVSTGMRRGEILALRWSDIDLDRGTLTVNHAMEQTTGRVAMKDPKTGTSHRTLVLPKMLIAALIRRRGEQSLRRLQIGPMWQDCDLVVARSNGKQVTPAGFSHCFTALLKTVGLPHIRFHDLRHSYASILIQQKVSMKTISTRLGHSSIGVTMNTYGHLLAGVEEDAVQGWEVAMRDAIDGKKTKRAANDE